MDMVILGFGRVVLEALDYLLGVDLVAVSNSKAPWNWRSVSGCTIARLKIRSPLGYLHDVRGTCCKLSLQRAFNFWYEGRKSLIVGRDVEEFEGRGQQRRTYREEVGGHIKRISAEQFTY